jgi:predicted nucleotidyltransferase
MGRVFSWDEINTGKVPNIENFPLVIEEIKKRLLSMPEIIGAAFCGSILNGAMTIRSDIDVVFVYAAAGQLQVIAEIQKLIAFSEKFHIPFEPIMVSDILARTPHNGFDRLFWEHLSHSEKFGGIIKDSPQALIYAHNDIKGETLQYLARKRSKLEKRWTKVKIENAERYLFLGKVLSAPIHAARKTIGCYNSALLTHNDSKWEVMRIYGDYFGKDETSLLNTLVGIDEAYTQFLMSVLDSRDRAAYLKILTEIETHIPLVLSFLEMNIGLVEHLK